MNNIPILVTAIALLALSACDYFSGKQKIIENRSDYDLQVRVHGGIRSYYYYDSIFLVPHNSELQISDYSTQKGTYETDICEIHADSITATIINNDTLSVTINLSDTANWIYRAISINEKHGRGESECRRIITNADIE